MKEPKLPAVVSIRTKIKPGDVGYLTYLHGTLYAIECGWDETFETYVAIPLSEFVKSHSDREKIWVAERNGTIAGSIAIVQAGAEGAQLRWFLLHPDLHGQGIGWYMMDGALQFCRERGYRSVFLWTEARLEAAARLYRKAGFQLSEEKTHARWGTTVTEQRYDLRL